MSGFGGVSLEINFIEWMGHQRVKGRLQALDCRDSSIQLFAKYIQLRLGAKFLLSKSFELGHYALASLNDSRRISHDFSNIIFIFLAKDFLHFGIVFVKGRSKGFENDSERGDLVSP